MDGDVTEGKFVARDREIWEARKSGESARMVAARWGIGRVRVNQICRKIERQIQLSLKVELGPVRNTHYGVWHIFGPGNEHISSLPCGEKQRKVK